MQEVLCYSVLFHSKDKSRAFHVSRGIELLQTQRSMAYTTFNSSTTYEDLTLVSHRNPS